MQKGLTKTIQRMISVNSHIGEVNVNVKKRSYSLLTPGEGGQPVVCACSVPASVH